jgi:3-oxosteroid 1-dehydrogenase
MKAAWDVVILGSGVAGLAAALAAHEMGLRPLLLEKAATLGGGTVSSYGLIWAGQNHLANGPPDTRDEVVAYLRWLGGGNLDEARMTAFVDRAPEALRFFERCGIRFCLIQGLTDHYYGTAPGARATGRSIEAELISGYDLGDWREVSPRPRTCRGT